MYDTNFGEPGVMLRAQATALLPIYTFGKLSALEELGAKGVEVGEALRDRAQAEAENQVAQAYWGLQLARAGGKAATEALKRIDDAAATLRKLREQNSPQVNQVDVYKLEFFRRQVEARAAQAESGVRFATAALRLLTAMPPDAEFEVASEDLPETSPPPEAPPAYVRLAEEERAELRAVAAGIGVREREVLINERSFFPDFGLAGFFKWAWTTNTTRQLSPFAYDPFNDLGAGVGLVARMTFDIPIKLAKLEQARGELEKLERTKTLLQGAVRLEIEKAVADLTEAIVRAQKQGEAEKNARRWATAAFAAFDLGTGDTREVVDGFIALATASAEKAKALYDVQVSRWALCHAVGHCLDGGGVTFDGH